MPSTVLARCVADFAQDPWALSSVSCPVPHRLLYRSAPTAAVYRIVSCTVQHLHFPPPVSAALPNSVIPPLSQLPAPTSHRGLSKFRQPRSGQNIVPSLSTLTPPPPGRDRATVQRLFSVAVTGNPHDGITTGICFLTNQSWFRIHFRALPEFAGTTPETDME